VNDNSDDPILFMLFAAFAVVFILFLHDMANTPVSSTRPAHPLKLCSVIPSWDRALNVAYFDFIDKADCK
jgi:hypothetical protein